MHAIKSKAKFFIKIWILGALRSLFLLILSRRSAVPSADRVLIINLEGMGDLVAFTSVLKHYRAALSGSDVSLLMKLSYGLEDELATMVDAVISLDYRRFTRNPWYAARTLANLRSKGFWKVIIHDHAAAEVMGKIIGLSLGAKEVIGYEGFALQFERPFDANMAATLRYVERSLFPRFTTLVKSLDRGRNEKKLYNVVDHYRHIYQAVTGTSAGDYSTTLPVLPEADQRIQDFLSMKQLVAGNYAVVNLGSSQAWKNWPVERFVQASASLQTRGVPLVLIGTQGQKHLAETFKAGYHGTCLDLMGRVGMPETVALIAHAKIVVSNDTSATHIAIALKKPTLTILGGGHVGSNSHYGYADINRWVYLEQECVRDNWRCTTNLPEGAIAPCIDAISPQLAGKELEDLLAYLEANPTAPNKPFAISFPIA